MRQMTKGKVLAAAIVLAGLTAIGVYWFLARQQSHAHAATSVVIAAQEIPRGTVISGEMLRTSSVPADAVQQGVASAPEMVIGRVSKDRFGAGEPIPIDGTLPRNRLAYIVPPFMRAVTVALDPIIGVGGFLKPGDHVDVVATFNINNGTITKTVLQDVELLATGDQVVADEGDQSKGDKATAQPNATLAVMPTDAEKLILAESKGKLRLTLRRPDDVSFVQTKGVTGRSVIGKVPADVQQPSQAVPAISYSPGPSFAAPAPSVPSPNLEPLRPPEPAGKTITVIRGTKVEEAVVHE